LHSNVVAPAAANANDAPEEATAPLGPLAIEVSGATVSTDHVRVAGDASAFPTASIPRTENVCSPSLRPE
jgi:hypothetical protein